MKITKARLKQLIKEELGKEKRRHPGEAPPETLDDIISRIMRGGVDQSGGASDRLKKQLIDAVKKELGLKEGGYKGEGAMADSQLNRIADLAMMIDEMVSDETNLPEWVESKITKAQDYMSAVMNYMKGEMADAQEEMMREEEERETTPAQRKKIKKRAEEIKPSTIKQYGKKEGTSAAFGIATDQVLGET